MISAQTILTAATLRSTLEQCNDSMIMHDALALAHSLGSTITFAQASNMGPHFFAVYLMTLMLTTIPGG